MISSVDFNNPKRRTLAADRNALSIAESLSQQVDHQKRKEFLEIASGTGQHIGFFAPRFPNMTFQPTTFDHLNFASIRSYAADCPTKNIREPIFVDVSIDFLEWEHSPYLQPSFYDYMYNCNMMHIASWDCSVGLFRSAAILLKPDGLLFTYGPYGLNGVLTPESNVMFDRSLRARNPEWGIRDIVDLKRVAAQNGLQLKQSFNLPENNKLLTWSKGSPSPPDKRRSKN